jgi:hypothetical protein
MSRRLGHSHANGHHGPCDELLWMMNFENFSTYTYSEFVCRSLTDCLHAHYLYYQNESTGNRIIFAPISYDESSLQLN